MRKISRPQSSSATNRARQTHTRKAASAESIDQFKRVFAATEHISERIKDVQMQDFGTDGQRPAAGASRLAQDLDHRATDTQLTDARVEFAGLLANQDTSVPVVHLASQAPTSSQSLAPHLAELIAKHVRKMFVSEQRAGSQQAIMLQLNDESLSGTDLILLREDHSWRLEARSDSEETLRDIDECANELSQTFDELDLGQLRVQTINTQPSI